MSSSALEWSNAELTRDASISSAQFRDERLAVSGSWTQHYNAANAKFTALFEQLNDISPSTITDGQLAQAYKSDLGEALRYLAGPPISDDDLKVIADVDSMAPGVLKKSPGDLRKIFGVIEAVIDPFRFPWVADGSAPTKAQVETALIASSVLLAAQRTATERRNQGKNSQESMVKNYLTMLDFVEVPSETITTIVRGPQMMQFCGECLLGDRKADVVVRLHDTRILAIECKVSNSATNSVKRLNNDAAVKAGYWLKEFGTSQVVPAAMLAGVFKVLNLEQAQSRGLALFWSHDLDKLGAFIESTKR